MKVFKKSSKKRIIIRSLLFASLIVVLIFQYLNWNGFCYEEKRFLSKGEIIDRTLRLHFLSMEMQDLYKNNPYCCEIVRPTFRSSSYIAVSKVFGYFFHEVNIFFKKKYSRHPNESHKMNGINSNSCVTNLLDVYGESISEEKYQSNIKRIKSHNIKNK